MAEFPTRDEMLTAAKLVLRGLAAPPEATRATRDPALTRAQQRVSKTATQTATSVVRPDHFRAHRLTRARCWATVLELHAQAQKHETRFEWQVIIDTLGRDAARKMFESALEAIVLATKNGGPRDLAIWNIAWTLGAAVSKETADV